MRGATVCGVVGLLLAAARADAAPGALDKPAFTATPAELLAAANAAPSAGQDVVLLREDHDVSIDDRGRATSVWRMVFAVTTKAGADDWNVLSSTWLPSYQDKPKVRARVIDAGGHVTELDQALITDTPDHTGAPALDRRHLEASLPRLGVGSVVEEEVTTVDREPLVGGGAVYAADVGGAKPLGSMRITITSPRKLRLLAHNLPAGAKPKTETVGGRQRVTYSFTWLPKQDEYPGFLPPDARPYPQVLFTPVASWNAVARAYRAIVDKRIEEATVPLPPGIEKQPTRETLRALQAWVADHVRYEDGDVDDTAVIPSTPAEIVKRGTGDSKDMAILMLALLRQAGIRANLALINVGPGMDVERDLPGFNQFEHVLVRAQLGKTELWLDPATRATDPGRLPWYDQGRAALIISDDANALVTTPASTAADNVVREVRTFELAEQGAAKITEVSREGGIFEAEQRTWLRETAPDTVKKNLIDYVEREYRGKLDSYTSTSTDDLAKPFEVTVVARDALRGFGDRDTIDVYLFSTDALKKLPEVLGQPGDDPPPRKVDLAISSPHTYEIENRLVVPPGYTMPVPAPDRTRELGTFKLVEKQRVDGQTFIVTFRFETGKVRLTPAEVTKVQQAIRALRKEEALHVVIAQTGIALADKGKYSDAIAEVNKLIRLHPKEALHHQQLAQVLIKAGAGEAARREARKAVELEPKNADTYAVLGWVLQCDTFGQWLGFDHDRAGARVALEKARKLDPKHVGAARDLAALLERNPKGRRFETGSDLRAAIDAWRAVRQLDDDTDSAYALATALLWAGQGAEAEKVLRPLAAAERRDQLLIAAVAIASGPDAALRTATSLASGTTRTKYLGGAGGLLFLMRQYDAMRALFAEAKVGQGGSQQEKVLQLIARADKPFKAGKDPADAVIEMSLLMMQPERGTNPYWDKQTRDEAADAAKGAQAVMARNELMTSGLLEDITRSALPRTVEGDAGLWRIEIESGVTRSQVYVAADRGTPKVIADAQAPQGAGRHLLRLLAKNDEKSALRLLDWLAKDLPVHKTLIAHRFASLWGANLPRTRKDMEVAAAVLVGKTDPTRAAPILEACKPSTTNGQFNCDDVLAQIYKYSGKWGDLLDHARAWKARAGSAQAIAIAEEAYALAHLGKFDDADQLLADAIAKDPDDRLLVFTHSDLAVGRGQIGEAVRRMDPLTTASSPQAPELNNVAWLKLLDGSDIKGAMMIARRAVQVGNEEPHAANTAAALEAELGELGEAKQHLDMSVAGNARSTPGDADLYVHARIVEQLGYVDDAIAIYRRIKPEKKFFTFIPDAWFLAERRLKALGVKK